MTSEELIAKIKAEFERRIKILREDEVVRKNCTFDFLEGKIYGYEELISFLSTILSTENTDIKMYDLGQLIEKSEKQQEVLPEGRALIDANCLMSKLNDLHSKYEKKFDKTGYPGFESAMTLIDEIQGMILQMKSKARKK